MQPDVVTKYKAAAKITNGELLGASFNRCHLSHVTSLCEA